MNNFEFAIFADAWLVSDPNFFGDPSDPEQRYAWIKARRCNFNGDHVVDINDLMLLAYHDEVFKWLWQACWKPLPVEAAQASSQSMMSMPMDAMTIESPAPEPSVEEQIAGVEGNLDFLNDIWENEPDIQNVIDADRWEDFIDNLDDHIEDLKERLP